MYRKVTFYTTADGKCPGAEFIDSQPVEVAQKIAWVLKAVQEIVDSGIKEIDEETISNYLYTSKIPDPDLLIRTGGEMRVSNYLLWQIAYSEFIVINDYWPEFDKNKLTNQKKFL